MAAGKTELQKRLSNHVRALRGQLIVCTRSSSDRQMAFDHNNQVRTIMKDLLESRSDLSEGSLFACRKRVCDLKSRTHPAPHARHPLHHPGWRRRRSRGWEGGGYGLRNRGQPAARQQHSHECARDHATEDRDPISPSGPVVTKRPRQPGCQSTGSLKAAFAKSARHSQM